MEMAARWSEGLGTASGLRDALRSLVQGAGGEDGLWRLGDAERGLPSEAAWSAHDWVTRAEGQRACDPASRHVASLVRVAQAGTRLTGRSALTADDAVNEMRAAFAVGELPLGKADQLARLHAQVAPVAEEDLLEDDLETLVAAAKDDVVATDPQGRVRQRVAGLTVKQLATLITCTGRLLKPEKDQDKDDQRAKAARSFTKSPGPAGMSSYKLVLEAEGAAVVDSAIAALSAPVPGPDGERDVRPATQRRADALLEVVRRGVSSPGEAPKSDNALLMVTIGLDDLREGTNGAG